jgi:L-methionine (R)-S-oxide reductase
MYVERRACLRHKVHGPVFASFDGVTGGMILDLSEQGLSMQTAVPVEADRKVHLRLGLPTNGLPNLDPANYNLPNNNLADSEALLETTGYIAWADALGRAGVRFSELPAEARQRLDQWLALNDESPSRKAPKLVFDRASEPIRSSTSAGNGTNDSRSISLEADTGTENSDGPSPASTTIQYEFHSLGTDLNNALRIIGERARALLRGTGAAIALIDRSPMMYREMMYRETTLTHRDADACPMLCRASVGTGGPPLGTRVDANSGFSGECVRTGKALRCDDAETDSRVAAEICHRLRIRSIAAAPIRYEREVVGLVEVFSSNSFAFDEGDLAVLERLAQTALLTVSQSHLLQRG